MSHADDIFIKVPAGETIPDYLVKRANELQQPVSYRLENKSFDGVGAGSVEQTLTIAPRTSKGDARDAFVKAQKHLSMEMRDLTRDEMPDLMDTISALVKDGQLKLASEKIAILTQATFLHDFGARVKPLVRNLEAAGYTANAEPTEQAFQALDKLCDEGRFDDAAKTVIGALIRDYSGKHEDRSEGGAAKGEQYVMAKGIHMAATEALNAAALGVRK